MIEKINFQNALTKLIEAEFPQHDVDFDWDRTHDGFRLIFKVCEDGKSGFLEEILDNKIKLRMIKKSLIFLPCKN